MASEEPKKDIGTSLQIPQPTGKDALVSVKRAVIGSVPFAGPAATEIFNWFVKSPLEKRRDEWMRQVGKILEELRTKRDIDLESLQKDETFVDVVMQATHIAMRNHQEEKRDALRNAIANSAGPHAPEESKRQKFLQLIDALTPMHLQILKLFSNPTTWFASQHQPTPIGSMVGSLDATLLTAFPELRAQRDYYDLLWADLKAAGLIKSATLHVVMTPEGAISKQTTLLGDEFLAFISDLK